MALEIGSRLGHYDVTALIGEGGMGQVYRATDTTLDRDVALKVLPDAFTADPSRLRANGGKPIFWASTAACQHRSLKIGFRTDRRVWT